MTLPGYVTIEELRQATDMRPTARSDAHMKLVIDTTSRLIEQTMHRRFYPELDTRYFDWPNAQFAAPWRLWLDADELASDVGVTMTVAGVSVSSSDFILRPDNGTAPPFTRVEIDLGSSAAFSAGASHQRSIAITGLFGYRSDEATVGTLAEALDAVETGIDVSDSSVIGVGSIIRVDSERMLVTGKTQITTGQSLQTPLIKSMADVTVAVTTGSAYTVGEVILLDAERMLITDIAGNNLVVKRAWDGTVLALHTAPIIYAQRTLVVERGALGTTAATHSTSTPVYRFLYPGVVQGLATAVALQTLHQQELAYASTTGGQLGQSARESTGRALAELWDRAYGAVGRKHRVRAA